ncbi:hypothetical protein A2U01_0101355, partial [Trifolium medium]|nr:hypothetical protein [Trifolium medium]
DEEYMPGVHEESIPAVHKHVGPAVQEQPMVWPFLLNKQSLQLL